VCQRAQLDPVEHVHSNRQTDPSEYVKQSVGIPYVPEITEICDTSIIELALLGHFRKRHALQELSSLHAENSTALSIA